MDSATHSLTVIGEGTHAEAPGDEAGDDRRQQLMHVRLHVYAGVPHQRLRGAQQQRQVRQRAEPRRRLRRYQLRQVRRQRVQTCREAGYTRVLTACWNPAAPQAPRLCQRCCGIHGGTFRWANAMHTLTWNAVETTAREGYLLSNGTDVLGTRMLIISTHLDPWPRTRGRLSGRPPPRRWTPAHRAAARRRAAALTRDPGTAAAPERQPYLC